MEGMQSRTRDLDRSDLAARHLDFTEIPLIDIADLYAEDPAARRRVADEIGKACETVGFLYVKGHPVPLSSVEGTYDALAKFFALPDAEKLRYDIHAQARHRGYVPLGGLNADPHQPGVDLQEGFEIGLELPEDDPDYLSGNMMHGPNVWPETPADFQAVVYDYFDRVHMLGRDLFRGFALALDLPEHWFEDKIGKPMTQLRAIHYPPQDPVVRNPKEIGIGAHSDYECFTILAANRPGLQVVNRSGQWIDAPPIEGTFIINIGDMMERWTNGRFVSTVHRVINTTGAERYSMAFFFGADYETIVECLPTCCGPDNPPRYPPVKAGDWTTENIKAAYTYKPSTEARSA